MKRAYNYLRISTEKQPVENKSVVVQLNQCRQVARKMKVTLIPDSKPKTYMTTIKRISAIDEKEGTK